MLDVSPSSIKQFRNQFYRHFVPLSVYLQVQRYAPFASTRARAKKMHAQKRGTSERETARAARKGCTNECNSSEWKMFTCIINSVAWLMKIVELEEWKKKDRQVIDKKCRRNGLMVCGQTTKLVRLLVSRSGETMLMMTTLRVMEPCRQASC